MGVGCNKRARLGSQTHLSSLVTTHSLTHSLTQGGQRESFELVALKGAAPASAIVRGMASREMGQRTRRQGLLTAMLSLDRFDGAAFSDSHRKSKKLRAAFLASRPSEDGCPVGSCIPGASA